MPTWSLMYVLILKTTKQFMIFKTIISSLDLDVYYEPKKEDITVARTEVIFINLRVIYTHNLYYVI